MREDQFMKRLAILRKATGKKQYQFADDIDMNKAKYNKLENGTQRPSISDLNQLAEAFNVSVDYLIGSDKDIKEEENTTKLSGLSYEIIKENTDEMFLCTIDKIIQSKAFVEAVSKYLFYSVENPVSYKIKSDDLSKECTFLDKEYSTYALSNVVKELECLKENISEQDNES